MPHRYIHSNNDLLSTAMQEPSSPSKRYRLVSALALGIAGVGWLLKPAPVIPSLPQVAPVSATVETFANSMPPPAPTVTEKLAESTPQWQIITIKKGDTLSKVFAQVGLSAQQLQAVMAIKEAKNSLIRLQPGHQIQLLLSPDKQLQQLKFELNAIDTLEIAYTDKVLKANITHQKVDTQLTYASATVVNSLVHAARKAGLQHQLTTQLIAIFKDKIDLAKVRPGDRFKILFEEDYVKGKRVRTGNIIAAEINLQGDFLRAVRYVDAKGNADYYTPEGLSLKRGFSRYPLNYTHISSGYSLHRFHPILHRFAAHEAIDFAAPMGTPIKAAGDGKINFAGVKGGYGNVIVIQHDKKYASLYAHMQHFATDIRPGTWVKQNQVIGYVGRSGIATGPHLHYEFHVNGVKRNPLTVALPDAAPLDKLARAKFIPQAQQLMARLQNNQNIHLVDNKYTNISG